jgi:hypothetical protein
MTILSNIFKLKILLKNQIYKSNLIFNNNHLTLSLSQKLNYKRKIVNKLKFKRKLVKKLQKLYYDYAYLYPLHLFLNILKIILRTT